MGTRAVIVVKNERDVVKSDTGIYLHWNGGIESIIGFLKGAERIGLTSDRGVDQTYFVARL
jgi:hypothetical protein